MSSWSGQSRGGVLGYRIFIFLINRFGVKAAYALLRFVAFYFVLFAPSAAKAIYRYFHAILKYPFPKAAIGVYQNFYVFGQTIIDKVALLSGSRNPFTYEFEGEEYLREMTRDGGGLLISAHIGNWEIAGQLLNRLECPFNIVMYDREHRQLKKYLSNVMAEKQVKVIVIKNDLSHIFQISAAIGNGELVCFHGDRFVEGAKTLELDFMNRKALFPAGPFQIATRLKVPYSFVFAMKETATHYHLYASPGQVAQGSIDQMTGAYVKTLEKMIARYPRQWFNYYDFWTQRTLA